MAVSPNRLYRSRRDRMLGGVAAGLGDYFDVDPTLVRLLFVLGTLFSGGIGLLVYIIMCFIVPPEPETTTVPQPPAARPDDPPPGAESTPAEAPPEGAPPVSLDSDDRHARRQAWAGIILIALGLLFLAHNLNWTWWVNWKVFWPGLLIVVGLLLLARRIQTR